MGLARIVYAGAITTGLSVGLAQNGHANELFGPSHPREMYSTMVRAGVLYSLVSQNPLIAKAAQESGMFSQLASLKTQGIAVVPTLGGFPSIHFGEGIGSMNIAGDCLEISQRRIANNGNKVNIKYVLCSDYDWGATPRDNLQAISPGMSAIRSLQYLLRDPSFAEKRANAISFTEQAYQASVKVAVALEDAQTRYNAMMEDLKGKITPLRQTIAKAAAIEGSLELASNLSPQLAPYQMILQYDLSDGQKIRMMTANPVTINGCAPITTAMVERDALYDGKLYTFQYSISESEAQLSGVMIEGNVPYGQVTLVPGDDLKDFFTIPKDVVQSANEAFAGHAGQLLSAANLACQALDSAGKDFLDQAQKAKPQDPPLPGVAVKKGNDI